MINKNAYIWLMMIVPLILGGCIDQIPLETNGEVDQLVIQGSINNGPGPYLIKIGRSGDFSEDQLGISQPVSGATVVLRASNGSFTNLTETTIGSYETTDLGFRGEIGTSYFLQINTPDGESYSSVPEKLLPVPAITSIEVDVVVEKVLNTNNSILEKDFIRYFVNTSIPNGNEAVGLKWNFEGIYEFLEKQNPSTPLASPKTCFVSQIIDLNKVVLQEGKINEGVDVNRKQVFKHELDTKYANKYCFHLYQQSLTPAAFEFWDKVEKLVGRTGSLFESPPGKISGNIFNTNKEEDVLGYFFASAIDTMRIYTTPRSLDRIIRQPCDSDDPELVDICFNCTLLSNSTLSKPIYWE